MKTNKKDKGMKEESRKREGGRGVETVRDKEVERTLRNCKNPGFVFLLSLMVWREEL